MAAGWACRVCSMNNRHNLTVSLHEHNPPRGWGHGGGLMPVQLQMLVWWHVNASAV
jgi:hypothetical protein